MGGEIQFVSAFFFVGHEAVYLSAQDPRPTIQLTNHNTHYETPPSTSVVVSTALWIATV